MALGPRPRIKVAAELGLEAELQEKGRRPVVFHPCQGLPAFSSGLNTKGISSTSPSCVPHGAQPLVPGVGGEAALTAPLHRGPPFCHLWQAADRSHRSPAARRPPKNSTKPPRPTPRLCTVPWEPTPSQPSCPRMAYRQILHQRSNANSTLGPFSWNQISEQLVIHVSLWLTMGFGRQDLFFVALVTLVPSTEGPRGVPPPL